MAVNRGFDEVMIVNPHDPRREAKEGVRLMGFYYGQPPEFGYYGEEPYLSEDLPYGEVGPYGYYGEAPEYGYFAEEPYLAEELPYGEVEPYGYYAQTPELYGWGEYEPYGEYEPVGYFAEEYPIGDYGEPPEYGYFAEEPYLAEDLPYGEYEPMGWYGQVPEMVGWGQYEPYSEYEPYGYYGEAPEFSGYVRDLPPTFNAGCPMPTNVAGLGESVPLEGYVRPRDVSPTCEQFTPQPGPTPSVPDTFKPLW